MSRVSNSDAANDRSLQILMFRRLLRGNKTRAHVHPGSAHRQRGHEASRISHAAGGDERDLQFVGSAREEDHVGRIIFAGMATALKAIDTHRVAADALGLKRMANR
jgi:hypothetical protein